MRIGLVRQHEAERLCAINEDRVVILAEASRAAGIRDKDGVFADLGSFLHAGEAARNLARSILSSTSGHSGLLSAANVRFAAPFVRGGKILCQANNYPGHSPFGIASRPFFYYKPATAVIGNGDLIAPHSAITQELDWEAELALVIGRRTRDVTREAAYDCVAGYTILNDVSRRDLQFNRAAPDLTKRYGLNLVQGKGLDGSCPIGPWITLTDELPDPYPLSVRSWVNGELRQNDNTEHMFYKVPDLLAEISRGMTLLPGDIISTGSPFGTGLDTGRYLHPGDVVRCEIENIGLLQNSVGLDQG